MAQIVVAPALRSTNATLRFPANGLTIPANAQFGSVVFDMPVASERASTGAHMDFSIDVQVAPSTVWKPYLQARWNGGTGQTGKHSTVLNPPPSASVGGDFFQAFAGEKASISIKLTQPMTLGGTITSSRFV
jgi:hypothetical protein